MAIKQHVPNHQVTAHSPSTLEKIKRVPIGGKLSEVEQTFGSILLKHAKLRHIK